MKLMHFSQSNEILPMKYEQVIDRPYVKPRGLWVSDETDFGWREWCIAEEFGNIEEQLAYEVRLQDDANILYLTTEEEVLAFGEEYSHNPLNDMPNLAKMYIKWQEVSKKYQGIIITPYQWGCRLDPNCMWYYGWDCASGCIWDFSCIESTTKLKANLKAACKFACKFAPVSILHYTTRCNHL